MSSEELTDQLMNQSSLLSFLLLYPFHLLLLLLTLLIVGVSCESSTERSILSFLHASGDGQSFADRCKLIR